MKYLYDERPIIACSTGKYANTAISVVRLSGFLNLLEFQGLFELDLTKIRPRYSHLTKLLFESTVVDQILMVFFPKNSSFTGENILELHLHGNLLNIERVIAFFVSKFGFREALPGEFSYRAFQNKRLSLSQVEGLDLFLNAQNPLALDQGLELLQGNLHATYLRLYDLFLKISSSIELLIDFSEDIGEEEARKLYFGYLSEFKSIISGLSLRCGSIGASILNPEIVIVGETNAGKSTFFNALLNANRAIVSSIKGTTRDYISEHISYEGVGYNLIDTAGIRETVDEIEKIGISRSFEKIKNAFYKILIINPNEIDRKSLLSFKSIKFDLVIFSHADLPETMKSISNFDFEFLSNTDYFLVDFKGGSIGPDSKSGSMGPDSKSGSIGPNGKSGSIGPLKEGGSIGPAVLSRISNEFNKVMQKNPILLDRHRNKINELNAYIESRDFNNLDDIAIVSSNISGLGVALSELIGQITPDDVLNSIFSNFCIGK